MGLPSQSSVSSGRSWMYRRRSRRMPRKLLAVPIVGLAVAGAWGIHASGVLEPGEPSREQRAAAPGSTRSVDLRSPLAAPDNGAAVEAERTSDSLDDAIKRAVEPVVIAQGAGETDAPPAIPAPTKETQQGRPKAPERRDKPSRPDTPASPEAKPAESLAAGAIARLVEEADLLEAKGRSADARRILNEALHHTKATPEDRQRLRRRLTALNDRLVFSPNLAPDDPIASAYEVKGGDILSRIVRKQNLGVDWRAIQDINRLPAPERIRVGQQLKLVRGPFHAIVIKHAFRLDLYWGPTEAPGDWLYIRSFPVGLGEDDSTPIGTFNVKRGSKLADPAWTNPRTGERFRKDDPDNPIGDYWVGIEGRADAAVHTGYGLHGTIEPDSIGTQRSMGCIRLLDDDIRTVYSLLSEENSIVHIRP